MDNLVIKKMNESNIPDIVRLEKICFSQPWSYEELKEELSNKLACFIVAMNRGVLCGYAGMHCICDEAYVTNIAVFPEFRRQNVGSFLLRNLITNAKEKGCVFLSLEVRTSNSAAISLYKSMGFEKMGLRKNFYKDPYEDASIMTLYFNK